MHIPNGPVKGSLNVTMHRDLDSAPVQTSRVQIVAPNGCVIDVTLVGDAYNIEIVEPDHPIITHLMDNSYCNTETTYDAGDGAFICDAHDRRVKVVNG